VAGDLGDTDSLVRAMTGADKVFSLRRPGPPDSLATAAPTASVTHVVLLTSAMAEPGGPDNPLAEAHRQAEAALINAGVPATFLRPTAFASNSLDWAETIRDHDAVRAPFGQLRLAVVDPRDVGDVAAAILACHGHEGNAYLLTCPAVLSIAEQVEVIGQALGRDITFSELSEDRARAHMLRVAPPMVVDALLSDQRAALDTIPTITHTVETITDRPPRTYRQWVDDHLAAFK
jgi:(4-alkanoyl-5-oxo-2,5-dihydrofuran-3-yl)methyl phosphate reductase